MSDKPGEIMGKTKELISAIRGSMRCGPMYEELVDGDDDPVCYQRKEWLDWVSELAEDACTEITEQSKRIQELEAMLKNKLGLIACGIEANYSCDPFENELYLEAKRLVDK